MKKRFALVVPALELGGGVPAVADFLWRTAARDGTYDVKIISLSTSARDDISVRITRPATWLRGACAVHDGRWEGRSFARVGAVGSELEFQRFLPRSALTALLQDCHFVQVVSGSPAWANAVIGHKTLVSLQVATRAKLERRLRDSKARTPLDWWRRGMTQITDLLDRRALCRVDAIQVENPWMLEYSRRVNAHRSTDVRYAPPGVDSLTFRPVNQDPSVRLVRPYVLAVGRLSDPRKNLALLVEAFAIVAAMLRGIDLVIAGSSEPGREIWDRIDSLGLRGRVRHVRQPDRCQLVRLYQHASVFVLSSDEEGLGVVVLEAMACGVPVVATACGGPNGIVTEGVDGFLVSVNDAAAMARCIALLLTDSSRNIEMGVNARRTIEARYDEVVAGQAFLEVWDLLWRQAAQQSCAG